MIDENQKNAKMEKPVVMQDDSIRDFGKRGQIQKETTFNDNGFHIKFFLITGKILEVVIDRSSPIYDLLASRGAIEYVGNSVAGVYIDKEGLHPEDFELGIENALAQLARAQLNTRKVADNLKGYGDLIRAIQHLRPLQLDKDGRRKFSDEECSYETVKASVLNSDEETNKTRMGNEAIKALIEEYKLERQRARTEKAKARSAESNLDGLL
ncbi:hypothetical protein ABXJ76_04570 [Methylobacter sp. G7]|uniref:hypothetical protein n=1 Tax=Methylobacter sp. G7 TaxID=3230117 RepID=UPI003D804F9C